MNPHQILTERFRLKTLTVDNVTDQYVGWLNDKETSEFIGFSKQQLHNFSSVQQYVKAQSMIPEVIFLGIFLRTNNQHIGNIKFEMKNTPALSAEMGIMIGERDWRGRGVAVEVLEASSIYLQETLGLKSLFLGVSERNIPAIKAYKKAKFIVQEERPPFGALKMTRSLLPSSHKRLAIGTVQFGLPYGISNQSGQVTQKTAKAILETAASAGIDTLDTAAVYGSSEEVLGQIGINNWKPVIKLPAIPDNCSNIDQWVRNITTKSLNRLKLKKVHGLLLHNPVDLMGRNGAAILKALQSLKTDGVIEKVGYSVYSPDELARLWSIFKPDIIQIPFNIIDQRMLTTGWLERLQQLDIEIHARSIFLQGLLLMKQDERPSKFKRWSDLWSTWHDWLREQNLTPLQACLSFVLMRPEIDRVVMGVENVQQLNEILTASKLLSPSPPDRLSSQDENLINPSQWNTL